MQEGGLNYRRYRIAGDFKNNYDLHDYPFDEQQLLIRFQNRKQRPELVTYVVDRFGLELSNGNSVAPGDRSPYSTLQQWRLAELRHFVDSLSSTTLFLPANLFRERINIPVTAILTSAVLLSVNNQLGDIGYTITIEYIFYAFFALCLASMLIGIAHDALSMQGRNRDAVALARGGQTFYVVTVVAVIAYYWLRYGR